MWATARVGEECVGCGKKAMSRWLCPLGREKKNYMVHGAHLLCLDCAEFVTYDGLGVLATCPGNWTEADLVLIALARPEKA